MKKMFDSRFLLILALSLIVLIILGVGAFYLFDDSDATFVMDGYVLNPLSAKSEKYFFDKETTYKENLNQMVVFDDVDKNEVKVLKDSFLHYMNGSLSFLKNGAILDLDSIRGTSAVKFYNITNKSIINKNGNGYVIETNGDDIGLKDFIGRISDNKYIVVGSLETKIPGNDKNISGEYFEIVYTDEGIINIENKDIKFQVAAQGSYIYTGDIVIDLGDKKITKSGEDVMSITAITINGGENIEIIPKAPEEDTNGGTGNDNQGNNDNIDNPVPNNQDGNGTGDDGTTDNNQTHQEVVTEELQVLLDPDRVLIDSSSITVAFRILNSREDDYLTLRVTDLSTGRTVNGEVIPVDNKKDIPITLLAPENKYLFTVVNERDGNKYFQKIFETSGFGISLEKSYVTSNQIGYKVKIEGNGNVQDARLTLKKFDESKDVNQLATVTSYRLKDIIDMTAGEHDGIIFENLDSDTIYTAVLDSFSVASTNFNDIYNITLTSMTLKQKPVIGDLQKEETNDSFKLYIENVEDPDNAITKYTYKIYNASDIEFENPIKEIETTDKLPVEVSIGEREDDLKVGEKYVYRVAIEYFDNEKYIEEMKEGSINLSKGKDPYVVIREGDDLSYNRFEALIYLYDVDCQIDLPGKCDISSAASNDSVKVMVYELDAMGKESLLREYTGDSLEFIPDNESGAYVADLFVKNLNRDTEYAIYVMAEQSKQLSTGFKPINGTDNNNRFTTKKMAILNAVWDNSLGSPKTPIETMVKLENGDSNPRAISPEETVEAIKAVIFKLYNGEYNPNMAELEEPKLIAVSAPIYKSNDLNILDNFFDKAYSVTLSEALEATFNMSLNQLAAVSNNEDGLLSPNYTIVMNAYYDYEMTEKNAVTINANWNLYHINPELRNVNPQTDIQIDAIKKDNNNANYFDSSLPNGLVVGYELTSIIEESKFDDNLWAIQDVNYYVYDDNRQIVTFYVLENGEMKPYTKYTKHKNEEDFNKLRMYMGYGSSQGNVMTRGNNYYIGYEIIYSTEGSDRTYPYPSNDNSNVPATSGFYKAVNEAVEEKDRAVKARPTIEYMYVWETTKDGKATYKYKITDIDNALVKTDGSNYIYYNVNNEYRDQLKIDTGEAVSTSGLIAANIPVYEGNVILSDLANGDGYTLFYRVLLDKNDGIKEDSIGIENREFDGYYEANNYNFKFEIEPYLPNLDMAGNNKIIVKMLANKELLPRILSYKIKFADRTHDFTREVYRLSMCPDATQDDMPRCYILDYTDDELKNMKTIGSTTNEITVSVEAIYDNGLTGYAYEDKVSTSNEARRYPYMIMQENCVKDNPCRYRIINSGKSMWSEASYPSGYYRFRTIDNGFYYTKMYKPTRDKINGDEYGPYGLELKSDGYNIAAGAINPKMVYDEPMVENEGKNKFAFSSIMPTIRSLESETISLINGALVNVHLYGADPTDICIENSSDNCNTGNGNRYLYLDVWENESDVNDITKTPIDTIKIPLDNDPKKINKVYTTKIDDITNLLHNHTYYYTIYTYLNENGRKRERRILDDDLKNSPNVYHFKTKELLEIFDEGKLRVDIIPNNNGEYNDKLLSTSIVLNKYSKDVDIPFNFKISYVLCDVDKQCDLTHNILKKTINEENEETTVTNKPETLSITDLEDITSKIDSKDIEFGKEYMMQFYVTYDTYDSNKNVVDNTELICKKNVLGDRVLNNIEFTNVARMADYVDNDYIIELKISLSDTDRLLKNGKYYVELRDTAGNLQGNLQLSQDGNFVVVSTASDNYNEYPIEALDYQTIRIGGLDSNTLYTVKVFGYSYVGDTETQITSGENGKGHFVYSSNDFGVAFGNNVLYTFADSTEENTIIANFGYASHLTGNTVITSVTYDIRYPGAEAPLDSKTLSIAADEIHFDNYANTDNLIMKFKIDPGVNINPGAQYIFTTSYDLYDPVTDRHETIDCYKPNYSSLSGPVVTYNN